MRKINKHDLYFTMRHVFIMVLPVYQNLSVSIKKNFGKMKILVTPHPHS